MRRAPYALGGLSTADDRQILAWAAESNRIILTHDRATLPNYAYERLASGERTPGVFILHDRLPIGESIQEIVVIIECTEQAE
jgi:hypothetical protein